MAHFARVNSDNQVIYVTPVNNNIVFKDGKEDESLGVQHLLKTLSSSIDSTWQETDTWVKTSYNSSIRNKYASIGDTWRADLDAFIEPKPFSSWIFNTQNLEWEAPLEFPNPSSDRENYYWDEDAYQADNTAGWILIE